MAVISQWCEGETEHAKTADRGQHNKGHDALNVLACPFYPKVCEVTLEGSQESPSRTSFIRSL